MNADFDVGTALLFQRFCALKVGVNGPDIHMKTAVAGTAAVEDENERVWRLMVYNNFCSTPPAAAIWARWSQEQVLNSKEADHLESWVRAHWKGIPIRQNRRPVRSVPKLTRSLVSAAEWLASDYPSLGSMSYPEAWDSLDKVWSWGRYVKIKFLETARSALGFEQLESPTIQSSGGWSPRKALALMWPGHAEVLTSKSSSKSVLAQVHAIADVTRDFVGSGSEAIRLSNYQLEALLCNFRQTLSTRKTFYVGRTIDSELEYDRTVTNHFGEDPYLGTFDFYGARKIAFPVECLGEAMGWDGVRPVLSDVLRLHGYVWSDTVYDFKGTTDFANPRRWDDQDRAEAPALGAGAGPVRLGQS